MDPDIDEKGHFCTNAPRDFHRIFAEILEVPIAKRMKELALEVLGVLKQITLQFQRFLHILLRVSELLLTLSHYRTIRNLDAVD